MNLSIRCTVLPLNVRVLRVRVNDDSSSMFQSVVALENLSYLRSNWIIVDGLSSEERNLLMFRNRGAIFGAPFFQSIFLEFHLEAVVLGTLIYLMDSFHPSGFVLGIKLHIFCYNVRWTQKNVGAGLGEGVVHVLIQVFVVRSHNSHNLTHITAILKLLVALPPGITGRRSLASSVLLWVCAEWV